MNPKLTIHRAAEEIGGNAVEISLGPDSILLDLGSPLPQEKKRLSDDLPTSLANLAKDTGHTWHGIVLSHVHADHSGLLHRVPPHIPIYLGTDTRRILGALSEFSKTGLQLNSSMIQEFSAKDTEFQIGPFRVLPIPVNHSAYGSYAFLISVQNRKIFYSGDLRAHGNSSHKWKALLRTLRRHSPADIAIIEGTTVHREQTCVCEKDIEDQFVKVLRDTNGLALFQFSPSHTDRLAGMIRATLRAGRSIVLDSYFLRILDVIGQKQDDPEGRSGLPHWNATKNPERFWILEDDPWRGKLVDAVRSHSAFGPRLLSFEKINQNPQKYVLPFRASGANYFGEKLNLGGAALIHSQWEKYRERQSQRDAEDHLTRHGLAQTYQIHTTGHILTKDLQSLVEAANPNMICPVHTDAPASFERLFPGRNVLLPRNGQIYDLL